VLEESLQWSPQVGDAALSEADRAAWRSQLQELAPYVLARIGADRVEEARRDASRLRNLIFSLEPVTDIRLTCGLDGHELPSNVVEREAFVEVQDDAVGTMLAFVRWGESAWPPTEDDADALATAFGEVFGPNYFESFLALIRAPSNAKRESLLRRAGAPTDIEDRRRLLFQTERAMNAPGTVDDLQPAAEPKTAAHQKDGELPAEQPMPSRLTGDQPKQMPLYSFDQIVVDGAPLILTGGVGAPAPKRIPQLWSGRGGSDGADTNEGNGNPYGGHTDLDMLNALGIDSAQINRQLMLR
jgi:hypothetical protein